MLNVEAKVREYIQKRLGVPAYVQVPENPPRDFATVERTNGSRDGARFSRGTVTVVVDYYGGSRQRAFELATSGDDAMSTFAREDRVISVEYNSSCVHYPDVASMHERYESIYVITAY